MLLLRILNYGFLTLLSLFIPVYRTKDRLSYRRPKTQNCIRGKYDDIFSEAYLSYMPSNAELGKLSTKIIKPNRVTVEISDDERSIRVVVDEISVLRIADSKYKISLGSADEDLETYFVRNFHQFNKFNRIPIKDRLSLLEPSVCATLYFTKLLNRPITEKDVIYLLRCGISYKNFLETYKGLKDI